MSRFGTKHVTQSYTIVRLFDVNGNPCDSEIFDESQHEDLSEHLRDISLWGVTYEQEVLLPC